MSGALLAQSAGIMAGAGGASTLAGRILGLHLDTDYTDVHGHTFSPWLESGQPAPRIRTDIRKFGSGSLTAGLISAVVPEAAWNGCYIGFWVYVADIGFGGWQVPLVRVQDNPGTKWGELVLSMGDYPNCRLGVSTELGGAIGLSSFPMGGWHYAALGVSVSASNRILSVQQDGVEVATLTVAASALPTAAASYRVILGDSFWWEAISVDDFQMFNVPRGVVAPPSAAFPDS